MLATDTTGAPGPATPLSEPDSWPWSVRAQADSRGYRVLFEPVRISQENYFRGAEDALLAPDGDVLECTAVEASLAVTWRAGGGYVSAGIPPDGGSAPVCGWRGACSFLLRTFDNRGTVVGDQAFSDVQDAPFDHVREIVQTADGGYALLAYRNNPRF